MSHPINRLESMLALWEDQFFVYGVIAEHGQRMNLTPEVMNRFPFAGPARHWRELRPHLREIFTTKEPLDWKRFATASSQVITSYGSMMQYPYFLRDWMIASRRVFHMTEELQALLNAMSFGEITWAEVHFPFDSFVVTLEEPITLEHESYDAIIVTNQFRPNRRGLEGEGDCVSIGLLSRRLESYAPLTAEERTTLLTAARKGGRSAHRMVVRYNSRFPGTPQFIASSMGPNSLKKHMAGVPLTEQAELLSLDGTKMELSEYSRAMDTAFRLVAGLCLYLASLPSDGSHRSEWSGVPQPGTPDPRSIATDAQICTVTSAFTLSSDERKTYLASSSSSERVRREVSAHFRRGHFRRRAGEGDDPDAPKVILVRPALVRGDRLAAGELPGAALARVK